MKFFFDNNLSPRIARAMDALVCDDGHQVKHLRERFLGTITDVDYMRILSEEGGWTVITNDRRISKNPHERNVWRDSDLVVVFLESGWRSLDRMSIAWRLIKRWSEICTMAAKADLGTGIRVPVSGRIGFVSR